MKNLLVIVILFTIISCSNENPHENSNLDVSNKKIETVLKLTNVDDQRIAFGLLNENEKAKLWSDKLNSILEKNELSFEQKSLILDLQEKLNNAVFTNNNSEYKEYFKNIFTKKYLEKLKYSFSPNEIENYFYNLNSNRVIEKKGDCDCNQGSLFGCGASNDCKNRTCPNATPTGCGFLWAWECNGLCALTNN